MEEQSPAPQGLTVHGEGTSARRDVKERVGCEEKEAGDEEGQCSDCVRELAPACSQ